MLSFELPLAQAVADFRNWLTATYSPEDVVALRFDDAGYPGWPVAQKMVSELLQANQVSQLSTQAQRDLLYLIARNWDVGALLGWMNDDAPLSNVGPLAEADLLHLARTAAQLHHPEYADAQFQVATCLRKLKHFTAEAQAVLLGLFTATRDDYTRHQALRSLAALGYSGWLSLLPPAWEASFEEHYKIALLHIIADYAPGPDLLCHYLALAEAVPGKHLADQVRRLRRRCP